MTVATRRCLALWVVIAAIAAAAPACVDVGHDAEVGCLADPNEPGCPGADAGDGAPSGDASPLSDAGVPRPGAE
jgi:hypothetical protein